jgi:2-polyprenyl-6-methoxyphenol hydroxylase-like FAD-dependent oxidoreductase
LHTAHFSIGSGTRMAMEDAAALAAAIDAHGSDIPAAFEAFEQARRPPSERLVIAADNSARWYERFADHMRLPLIDFAFAYIMRSGRVSMEDLRRSSPGFVAEYESHHGAQR